MSTIIEIVIEIHIFGRLEPKERIEVNFFKTNILLPTYLRFGLCQFKLMLAAGQYMSFWQTLYEISCLSGLNWNWFDEKETQESDQMWNCGI